MKDIMQEIRLAKYKHLIGQDILLFFFPRGLTAAGDTWAQLRGTIIGVGGESLEFQSTIADPPLFIPISKISDIGLPYKGLGTSYPENIPNYKREK